MKAHPKIAVTILSGKLLPLARKWRLVLIISIIAFLILPYPLNRLFGNTTFIVFFFIIVSIVLCSAAIYNHIPKFETIGRILLDTNGIEIKTTTDSKIIDIHTIEGIYFEPNDDRRRLPYLTGFLKILSDNRNRNYLTIKTVNETYNFELFIEENSLLIRLKKHIENFGNFGIRITIL